MVSAAAIRRSSAAISACNCSSLKLSCVLVTRTSPVAKAEPSEAAKRKSRTKHTDDGLPVHSFRTLLADLATIARNVVCFGKAGEMTVITRPTKVQQRALDLLGIKI